MPDFKSFNLEHIIEIYVSLERRLDFNSLFDNEPVRDEKILLEALMKQFNHKVDVFEEDLYENLTTLGRARDLYSLCFIIHGESKKRVEIWINTHMLPDGATLVNYCWKRFCLIKEACQVIIREEFRDKGWDYPDASTREELKTLIQNLVKFKFSMSDFENPDYPLDTKVENAAEILAILLLYPIDRMVEDQKKHENSDSAYTNIHFLIAEKYKVPERYVELLFSSEDLQRVFSEIRLKRDDV